MTARSARRRLSEANRINGSAAGAPSEAGGYTPDSYLAAITDLVRAARDEEAVALVKRHGATMLPQLTREQLVQLSSMMEGADAAIEATALISRRAAVTS